MTLFDVAESEARKEEGMARAAGAKPWLLGWAREVAQKIAKDKGTVTADDVAEVLALCGWNLGNAAGSLFRGKEWEWTGEFVKSKRAQAHRNLLRVWRLKQPLAPA